MVIFKCLWRSHCIHGFYTWYKNIRVIATMCLRVEGWTPLQPKGMRHVLCHLYNPPRAVVTCETVQRYLLAQHLQHFLLVSPT